MYLFVYFQCEELCWTFSSSRAPPLQHPLLCCMDPEASRLPAQVLGENEALQQFFNGGISS